jgi:hypothetical protein
LAGCDFVKKTLCIRARVDQAGLMIAVRAAAIALFICALNMRRAGTLC